ncbi:Protein UPSTREAM OF FLC [Parasponia andersonii]|uniref:Protein UPSTREAM OF FLC n=1 Tax=Parasponia andersonii TaxID=3476 RepID=A0A2P5C1Q7_PARAD|nr:Protein UPSTREAM OF FLC [Parasponia andersonii]
MEVRSRRLRETSPDRAKVCPRPRVKPIKKVQVVYYLSRNGHLEHPHYMEVAHFADQPLRLRDVMERLTILRGKGMPSLYSWSCKRSYKNGYVWNDLAENDIIYPAEGAEYVLKGSELVEGCSERLNQIQISRDLSFQTRQKPLGAEKYPKYDDVRDYEDGEEQEEYEDEEKVSYTSSTTPHSRCSRGVSTDELEEAPTRTQAQIQVQKSPSMSNKPEQTITTTTIIKNNNRSRRFEDNGGGGVVDRVTVSDSAEGPSRNSVLLQLIACGSSAVAKAKSSPCVKPAPAVNVELCRGQAMKRGNNMRSMSDLERGVVWKNAVKMAEDDQDMINYISENPRFGNLQSQEKEYFSGSIVESMTDERAAAAAAAASAVSVLKKSNSYNEERSTKAGLEETVAEEEKRLEKAKMRGKCIPRKKSSASSKHETKK